MRMRTLLKTIICFSLMLFAGCGEVSLMPGDVVINPAPAKETDMGVPGKSGEPSASLYNLSNISQPASSSSNMEYSLIGGAGFPVSIYADNKYLYLLRRGRGDSDGEYGKAIEAYNVDNASLAAEISHDSLKSCSAFTVRDSNIYAYDVNTGRILLFSSDGSYLSAYDTGLAGIKVEKIVTARNRFIILKIRKSPAARSKLAVYDIEEETLDVIETDFVFQPSSGHYPDITDFCLYGEDTILVGASTGRLYLYDFEARKTAKSCIFPLSTGYMEFDGNVLYYSSDAFVSLNPGNAANFSNVSGLRLAGRMLINSEFTWPETIADLDKWLMGDLPIPFAGDGRHYGMAQNNKYLFFLDLIPARNDTAPSSGDFTVYRIMK